MNKTVSQKERLARIRINAFSYMKSDWYERLLNVYESAENILNATAADISQNGAVSIETAKKFLKETSEINPEQEIEKTEKIGGKVLVCEDEDYPKELKEIPQSPIVLYMRGNLDKNSIKISFVGTRKPSYYGRRITTKLCSQLSKCKIEIVSGLARGIDSIAHSTALDFNGKTYAVIGTGLGKCYPYENKKLAEKIIETGGAIITEIPFERGPMAFHFPRRNRIIAGLSCLTVVSEGSVRSGSLITARMALEQGKDVMAVAGNIDSDTSKGPNMLIKNGAAPVLSVLDIIEHIPPQYNYLMPENLSDKSQTTEIKLQNNISEDEKNVINCIKAENMNLDELACQMGWDIPKTAEILFEMESKSIVTCNAGRYEIKI